MAVLLVILTALTGCVSKNKADLKTNELPASVTQGVLAEHPELTEQEMLTPCSECHKEESPEIYTQWYDSVHGIGQVKCYQCHGTFENMVSVPQNNDCAVCHAGQLGDHTKDFACWQCHKAHAFTENTLEGGQG